jgi:hypothetical protein
MNYIFVILLIIVGIPILILLITNILTNVGLVERTSKKKRERASEVKETKCFKD